jgi:hypothetical protein
MSLVLLAGGLGDEQGVITPGYDLEEMGHLLAVELNDLNQRGIAPREFPKRAIVSLLNRAQRNVIRHANRHLLPELDVTLSQQVLDENGRVDLTELSNAVFMKNKMIDGCKIYSSTDTKGKFCFLRSFKEFRKFNDANETATLRNPFCYLRGDYLYVEPYPSTDVSSGDIESGVDYYISLDYTTVTYNSVIYGPGDTFTGVDGVTTYTTTGSGVVIACQYVDIYYMREPVKMEHGSTEALDVDCELSQDLQDVIIEFAAYWGYRFGKDLQRAKMCWEQAMELLGQLNAMMPQTESVEYSRQRIERESEYAEREFPINVELELVD